MDNQPIQSTSKIHKWVRQSLALKIASIGLLIAILLIPSELIHDLIREREGRHYEAVREISDKWGHEQDIAGPVLSIPYNEYDKDKGDKVTITRHAHFLPEILEISGDVYPQVRYRGIYEAVLYNTKLTISGKFNQFDVENLNLDPKEMQWDKAFLAVGIPDMRGINENIKLVWNGQNLDFEPGIEKKDVIKSGLSARVKVVPQISGKDKNTEGATTEYTFSFNIDLNGSQALNFLPVGKETRVNLKSEWKNPSFFGSFLPDERQIDDSGFSASWKVLHLNRNFPQQWKKQNHDIYSSSFGVKLIQPVDEYSKTNRSTKYALLFILLTFTGFFFVEILQKLRIHPIQYLLVGIALTLFYLLLLSISEHAQFNTAYWAATGGIVGLITLYSHSIFRKPFLTGIMFGTLLALYVFLFTLLQMQDYSLLMGSLGLFVVLAVVMYVSRNVDWYNLAHSETKAETDIETGRIE